MRTKKYVEYWVSCLDNYGDILWYAYQGPSRAAAVAEARKYKANAATDVSNIEVERVTRWYIGEELEYQSFEEVLEEVLEE